MAQIVQLVVYAKASTTEAGSWKVDIFLDGKQVSHDAPLENPLGKSQQKTVRWYVETYAQVFPYSISLAKEARETLKEYSLSLRDQLKLKDVIPKETNGAPPRVVSMEIVEEQIDHLPAASVYQLHWELLEDPSLWDTDGLRVVLNRRSSSSPCLPADLTRLHHIRAWPQENTSADRINILLVVARDLTSNPAAYRDISPLMAVDILTGIRKRLTTQVGAVQLNLEIVRPGTYSAFTDYLSSRGRGYFHIVHFDMHGEGKRNGGYLYFNEEETNRTVRTPAPDVAKTLQRFQIPCVVLNACESARASLGHDANIAELFQSCGVRSVLGMSFKVSSSAAELFLQAFYDMLLIERAPFGAAASAGRDALRASPKRSARFGLERDVADWFVPVAYLSGADSVIQPAGSEYHPSQYPGAIAVRTADTGVEPRLEGRDFDLLRLEKMIIQQRIVYIHGPAGAGKSALLQYARRMWTETSFVDTVVYVDFRISTEDDIANVVYQQLHEGSDVAKESNHSVLGSAQSSNLEFTWKQVTEILQSRRTVLIFDNIDASVSVLGHVRCKIGRTDTFGIMSALQRLVPIASSHAEHPCYIIFADRRERFAPHLSEKIGYTLEPQANMYSLNGLELADAIELSHTILRQSGIDTRVWKKPDLDALELVLGALQCLPGAMRKILPLTKVTGEPWSSFYNLLILQTHKIRQHISTTEEPCTLWEVLNWSKDTQPSATFTCLMLLGSFWHEAPRVEVVNEMGLADSVEGNNESPQSACVLAIDRGLMEEGRRGELWIHPLWTIYARSWALWGGNGNDSRPSSWVGSVIKRLGFSVGRPSHHFMHALCEPAPSIIRENADYKEVVVKFMASVEMEFRVSTAIVATIGIDYAEMLSVDRRRFLNLLSCIHICLTAGNSLTLEEWPMHFLSGGSATIRTVGSVAEMTLFAGLYESLLRQILNRWESKAVPPEFQLFVLTISNYLSGTYLSDVKLPTDRSAELIGLALEIIRNSEACYGPIEGSAAIYLKGLTFRRKVILAVREENITDLDKYWDLSTENDAAYLESVKKEKDEQGKESLLPTVIQKLQDRSCSVSDAYVKSRKEMLGLKDLIIQQMKAGMKLDGRILPQMESAFDTVSYSLRNVHRVLQQAGYSGLEGQIQWPPELDVQQFVEEYNLPENLLAQLETARDYGDSWSAASQHQALMLQAIENADFDEVLEHVDAVEALYENQPAALLEDLSQFKVNNNNAQVMRAGQSLQRAFESLSDGSVDSAKAVSVETEKLVDAMRAQGAPADAIRAVEIGAELWNQALERDTHSLAAAGMDLGARSNRARKASVPLLRRCVRDASLRQQFLTVGLELQTLDQKRVAAQAVGDLDVELDLISRQLELTETEVGRALKEFLDPETLERDRRAILKQQKKKSILSCVDAGDFLNARTQMKDLAAHFEESDDSVAALWEVIERRHLTSEMKLAHREAMSSNPLSVSKYNELLGLYQGGGFSHMREPELTPSIKNIRYNRSWGRANAAFIAKQWEQAIEHLDECLAVWGDEVEKDPRKHAHVIDLKETSQLSLHLETLKQIDVECRYDEAQQHVDALEALFERLQSSPSAQSSIGQVLTREILDTMQRQLAWKKGIMAMMGQENGKAFILASRQAPGSLWPY